MARIGELLSHCFFFVCVCVLFDFEKTTSNLLLVLAHPKIPHCDHVVGQNNAREDGEKVENERQDGQLTVSDSDSHTCRVNGVWWGNQGWGSDGQNQTPQETQEVEFVQLAVVPLLIW